MVIANFEQGETSKKVRGIRQWDYGQVLRIQGLSLPTAVEIHFSLQESRGDCVTRIGVTKDGVTDVVIPDSMVENEGAIGQEYYIYAWVYLTDETSGHTECEIKLSVETRSKPEAFDKPEDAEIFREAIKAVNEAADRAEEAAKKEVTDGRIDTAVTEYLDENGIKTDKTLTVDGGIADAKATGDELAKKADKKAVEEELKKKADKENPTFTDSISMGRKADSRIGKNSTALGIDVTASNEGSYGEGKNNISNGIFSHVGGENSAAWQHCGFAHGYGCISDAPGAISLGVFNNGKGEASHVDGYDNIAGSAYQHVHGKWNMEDNGNKYAHQIGGGYQRTFPRYNNEGNIEWITETVRGDIYRLDWNGNAWYKGSVTSNGADYAEFFEWEDGNPNDEDRVGLLVTLDGEKIRLANDGDEILGIISGTAAVLGDNYECEWNGKYLTDDFGMVIYDKVEEFVDVITGIDEETNEPITEKKSVGIFKHPRINPDYDPEQAYINRAERPEWDTVGMLGKLYLRDDGTCAENGYVTVGENGIGTASREKTNMRVLSRASEKVIRVLLK